jgi:hypothetical protein
MKRSGKSTVVLTKMTANLEKYAESRSFDEWTAEDQADLDALNSKRVQKGLHAMSRDEYQDCTDAGNPPDTRTEAEKLAEHNEWRATHGHPPHTEREYFEFLANAPKFDWAGLREQLQAGGSGEDDELVKTCREHEAIDAGATKGVKQ